MKPIRKLQLLAAAAALAAFAPAAAQQADEVGQAARLDALFAELAEPERADWQRVEAEILREMSRSGSDAMDLLLKRGQEAMEAGDFVAAVEHLTALTDHAPGFAEGWNARATAFFLMEEYALSIADIERTLTLEPRHFGALAGLAIMLEALGDERAALEVNRTAHAIHPHRAEVGRAIERLERQLGGAQL